MAWHPWRDEGKPKPPIQLELLRACVKCGTPKPLESFRRRSGTVTRMRACRECEGVYTRELRHRKPEQEAERQRRYRQSDRYNLIRRRTYRAKRGIDGIPQPPRRWYSVLRAAAEIGLGDSRVRQLCAAGILTAQKDLRGAWRIDPASVEGWRDGRLR